MRFFAIPVGVAIVLAGCSVVTEPDVVSTSPAPVDTSVLVTDADELARSTLDDYVAITNQILGGAAPDLISTVVTPQWASEEVRGFLAVDALGGESPHVRVTRTELESVRGKRTLVDARLATCLVAAESVTRVTVHLVPRDARLIIAEIVPWEDATWCADSPAE